MNDKNTLPRNMDVKYFLEVNKNSSVQDIIVNLYKLDDITRNYLLKDENGLLKDKILSLLKNYSSDKYVLILESRSLSDFISLYGKDFIFSLDLNFH